MTDVLSPTLEEIHKAADGRFFCEPEPVVPSVRYSAGELGAIKQNSEIAKAMLDSMTDEQKHAYDESLGALVHGSATDEDVERVGHVQRLTETAWRYHDACSVINRAGSIALRRF